jgi:TRAP-type C4-dicarboxylate transport system permease small subunit
VKRVRELEGVLLRGEGGAVVVLVLVMLVLAGYNVVYRNVLVPLQSHWAHSGPPIAEQAEAQPSEKAEGPAKGEVAAKGDDAGGFRGAFGAPAEGGGETEGSKDEDEGDGAEDFGGAFGKPEEEDEGEDDEGDGAEGFGGAFGKPPPEPEAEAGDEPEDDLDDQFANLPDIDTSRKVESTGPQGGPPPPGSFAAWGVAFIEKLRLDWIDVLLRQLVILTSFLGAALATARGKHINIDALGKLLPQWLRRWTAVTTNLLALGVCLVLASAGKDLVAISREYPSEVTPFLDEWHLQLMFPLGFGLLALHFAVRVAEGVLGLPPPGEPTPPAKEGDA